MALYTSRPYSAFGRSAAAEQERRMARRRQQEEEEKRRWREHSQYLHRMDVRSMKQDTWSSVHARAAAEGHPSDKREAEKRREKRKGKMEERRSRLRQMLLLEQQNYEAELKEKTPDQLSSMKSRVDELKSFREKELRKVAEEQREKLWRANCPELREAEVKRSQKAVQLAWKDQVQHKKEVKNSLREEDERYEQYMEEERREALRQEENQKRQQKDEEWRRASALKRQMEEVTARETESVLLEKQQARLLQEQVLLEEAEEQRKQLEADQKKAELRRVLTRQAKAQLRRKSQRIQESLELDLKILEDLAQQEVQERDLKTGRREKARADAVWMKQVVKDQLQLEKKREAELEILYQEEAARMWQKKEVEWERERQARERLMTEVLAERQRQLEERIENLKIQQAESIQQREELLKEMEEESYRTGRETQRKEEAKTSRVAELQAQVTERRRIAEKRREQYEREREEQRLLEEEYEALVKSEAEKIVKAKPQMKHYGRRKHAWY